MLMNKILTIFCVTLALMVTACESSDNVADDAVEGITFQMTVPPELSVDTRAGASIGGVGISDVWVMQFDSEGKKLKATHFADDKISIIKENALVQVTTEGFSNVAGTFRIIVNFGASQSDLLAFANNNDATLSDLRNIVMSYSKYKSNPNFLVSDDLDFKGVDTDGKAVILAPLNFVYAWIDVKWTNKVTSPARFILTSIQAYNLPSSLALESRAGASSGVYPVGATNTYLVDSDASSDGLGTGSTYSFYMPENLRGMGCGNSFQEKNLPEYGPKSDGTAPAVDASGKPTEASDQLKNCTYIDLTGSYWYNYNSANPTATSPIAVRYRLYLGGNLITDYNVRRGYHYTITAQISGANSGDVRVTITDGNVVVFDDVEEINKTVDFGALKN